MTFLPAHGIKYTAGCAVTASFLMLTCLFHGAVPQNTGDQITCQASMHKQANITCMFNANINTTRQNFIVLFYKPSLDDTHVILSCNWISGQNTPKCFVEEGVNFNPVIDMRLTASVTPPLAEVGGYFECQLVPSDRFRSQKCYLMTAENVTQTQLPPITETTQPSDCQCSEQSGTARNWAIFLGITTGLLIALIAAFFVCLKTGIITVKWPSMCTRTENEHEDNVDKPLRE